MYSLSSVEETPMKKIPLFNAHQLRCSLSKSKEINNLYIVSLTNEQTFEQDLQFYFFSIF